MHSHALTSLFDIVVGQSIGVLPNDAVVEMQPPLTASFSRATKFTVTFEAETQQVHTQWHTKTKIGTMGLGTDLKVFLCNCYDLKETLEELTGYTEEKIMQNDGECTVVRAHPNYQSQGRWNDWALIRYGDSVLPAKFYCWIQRPQGEPEAIVKIASEPIIAESSNTTNAWEFPLDNPQFEGTTFHRIKKDQYIRECLVVQGNKNESILEVKSKSQWATAV